MQESAKRAEIGEKMTFNGLSIPAFGEEKYREDKENRHASVVNIYEATKNTFDAYVSYFEANGAKKREAHENKNHSYAAFSFGNDAIFLNFFAKTGELYVVLEENTSYFSYADSVLPKICEPQITQITLIDFGLSYVVRLSDGRFIIIDGGNEHDFDSDRLLETLKTGSVNGDIDIAAWIFTHPHLDHFHGFLSFMDRFFGVEKFTVEKFIFNFPEVDDTYHYPALQRPNEKATDTVPRMYAHIETLGAPIYTAHTGQKYRIGDAECEILASLDDSIGLAPDVTPDVNVTSLVIRMELGGEVILWAADSYFEHVGLADKYGEYLKSDILQVPHHGFGSGRPLAEIAAYKLISPSVCLMPVCDCDAYTTFCTYIPSSRYLMLEADLDELITGDEQRTLTLPYTPRKDGKEIIKRNFLEGLAKAGGYEWEYVLAPSSAPTFEISNGTHCPSVLAAEFFDESEKLIGTETLEIRGHLKTSFDAPKGAGRARFTCTVPLWVKHDTLEPTKRITTNI